MVRDEAEVEYYIQCLSVSVRVGYIAKYCI